MSCGEPLLTGPEDINRLLKLDLAPAERFGRLQQDGVSVLAPNLTIRYVNTTIKHWHQSELPLEGKRVLPGIPKQA